LEGLTGKKENSKCLLVGLTGIGKFVGGGYWGEAKNLKTWHPCGVLGLFSNSWTANF